MHPTGPLAGGAFAPYECFAAGKTSAQAGFIPAEHVKSPLVSIKITTPLGVVIFMEQVKGIEPSYSAWEADVLPLNYTCTLADSDIIAWAGWKCKGFFVVIQKMDEL